MIAKAKFTGFLIAFSLMVVVAGAQINIEREVLYELPSGFSYDLIGMRTSAGQVLMMNHYGQMIRYDLKNGEAFNGKIRGQRILDFDLVMGQPVYINQQGRLGGLVKPQWPDQAFDACKIEACEQGLLLTGAGKMLFLAQNATDTFATEGLNFALPIGRGYLWSVGLKKQTGPWSISLFDCYGNLIKEIYEFSRSFDPAGISLGPIGPEGEALISSYEDNSRKLTLVGQNGHMIWKIDGPEKFCMRDLAFDKRGNLLVLEKNGKKVVLSRWKFEAPQG
ncbi:MAG: hypothetical protein ACQETH_01645 [Candidatus Rifleibacteriota bacterium]